MSASRTALVAGNWKMNGSREMAADLARGIAGGSAGLGCELLVCPPAPYIGAVAAVLAKSGAFVGGQDCHAAQSGAHTGDVSAEMLSDCGCRFVIVGHSERRADHDESDSTVREKALAAHRAGLTAIVCVGETEAERDAGDADRIVARQLTGSVPADAAAHNTVVAYEPVWAIGTGRTPTPDDVQAMHRHMRAHLAGSHGEAFSNAVRLLYGGSVKPDNAASLMGLADVDGALVGGASLKAGDFLAIAESTGHLQDK